MSVTHSKVSAIPDGADTTVIRPSDWNAVHVVSVSLTSEVTGVLPVANGGTGGTGLTQNSVVIVGASGVLSEDNANFSYASGTLTANTIRAKAGSTLTLRGGTVNAGVAGGLSITATAGTGSVNGGAVTILSGDAASGSGGDYTMNAGTATVAGAGGGFVCNAGSSAGTANDAGNFILSAGTANGTGNGGSMNLFAGPGKGATFAGGNAILAAASGSSSATNGQAMLSVQDGAINGLVVNGDGSVYGEKLHNIGTLTGTTTQYIGSGTYTPTLTNVANLAASTAYAAQWIRVGNVVSVSGKVDVDPSLAATSTQLGISLPIASNLTAAEQCSGTAFASGIASQGAAILGDGTNDRAQMQWISTDITNQAMYYKYQYLVL